MGGVDSLITLLSHSKETVISNTCVILSNMSTDEEVRTDILKHGVIAALIPPLNSACNDVQVGELIVGELRCYVMLGYVMLLYVMLRYVICYVVILATIYYDTFCCDLL